MSEIVKRITSLRKWLPAGVKLVAVSKTKSAGEILEAYNTGHRIFGENRVQELLSKKDNLPPDIEWHLIGHLQTNKVKYIVPFISLIHSADSFRLLKVISDESMKIRRITDCLLQFHIANEETKFGFSLDEAKEMCRSEEFGKLAGIRICGVMGMATFTSDETLVRTEFKYLRKCFDELKESFFHDNKSFIELSMGMSGDYRIAIEEGSTMVRIGSVIFGERRY